MSFFEEGERLKPVFKKMGFFPIVSDYWRSPWNTTESIRCRSFGQQPSSCLVTRRKLPGQQQRVRWRVTMLLRRPLHISFLLRYLFAYNDSPDVWQMNDYVYLVDWLWRDKFIIRQVRALLLQHHRRRGVQDILHLPMILHSQKVG